MLVSGTYPALAGTASGGEVTNPNGYDIIFTSDAAGNNPLNFERESYSSATGQVVFWVQMPTISHVTDTTFYIFYGNASVSTDPSNKSGTWDSSYAGVWHLPNGSSLSALNIRRHIRRTERSIGSTAVAGEIDGGANLSGASQTVTMGNVLNLGAGNLTLEAWVRPSNVNQYAPILSKRQNSTNYQQYQVGIGSVNSGGSGIAGKTIYAFFYDGTTLKNAQSYHTVNNIVDGNWHHVVVTRDPTHNVSIYVDGVSQALVTDLGNTTAANTTNTGAFNIGYDNGSAYLTSVVDEARVSSTSRSADWISTEYHNESNPSGFYSATWGQTYGGTAPAPAITIAITPSTLSFSAPCREGRIRQPAIDEHCCFKRRDVDCDGQSELDQRVCDAEWGVWRIGNEQRGDTVGADGGQWEWSQWLRGQIQAV